MDKGKVLSSKTWRKKFREWFHIDVEEADIHKIFPSFGIHLKQIPYRQVDGYDETEVKGFLQRGEGLKNELMKYGVPWEKGDEIAKKSKKKPYIPYGKPKLPTYKYEPTIVADLEDFMNPPKQEYVSKLDIQPEYKNNENDMEKYSDYLIQQYQYEEYKPKKVIVTESQFKRLMEKKDL